MDLGNSSKFERVKMGEWKVGDSQFSAGLLWCVGIGAYREKDNLSALSHHPTEYELETLNDFLESTDHETTRYVVAGGNRMPKDEVEIDEVVEERLNQASGEWKDYRIGEKDVYQHNLFVSNQSYIIKSPTDEIREDWESF